MPEHDVVVVGAGISGLALAHRLKALGRDVLVLERAARPGGVIRTAHEAGFQYEQGPSTLLGRPELLALAGELGLGERVIEAKGPATRWVLKDGRLHPIPLSPPAFLKTRLIRPCAKLGLVREPFVARAPDGTEESIAGFVRRRLGEDFLANLVDPFVSGIFAGDPERLSLRWALPRMHALELEHGSLIRGAIKKKKGPAPVASRHLLSFPAGLEELPRALARGLGDRLRCASAVRALERDGRGFRLDTGAGERFRARQVVLAVEADAAASLLDAIAAEQAKLLAAIPYVPLAVVFLGFRESELERPFEGFGFLAARGEPVSMLGCLRASGLFPDRAPAGMLGLVAYVGGRRQPELCALDDKALVERVLADLRRVLGVRGEPAAWAVTRWPRAIPQYELGHGRFIEAVAALERAAPGLRIAGSYTGGVSIPDRLAFADRLARSIAQA